MKRRQLIRYMASSVGTAIGLGIVQKLPVQAQTSGVTVRSLGHMCFQFTGDGRRILVNPFRPIGCTAGYRAPNVATDLVMISSFLFDEGFTDEIPGNPRILSEPGIYQFTGMQVQGIEMAHDRNQGRQFGTNVAWRWNQAGLNILHLGGAAAPITVEQRILMGRPDVLLIPVGGGAKAYNPTEAVEAIRGLNPRIVIPTQYRTQAADANACDIQPIEDFLNLLPDTPVQRLGDSVTFTRSNLPENTVIRVLSYQF
ncbi:MBL fold metallo-hydrolase [Microcoleus sp. FACHB-1515]|uniref:MBL fold metallo-hydrolase n=1 Tax=Cyanophyceae TaxID=3028117 RepID=UPI0016846D69|nr:MBL fold metallo-hydrolase [Microcoleus sp. FACHB-1515]MBD2090180.1 MBL fold metallo-hydrolase [Microcoleus sp. FACHB-1515]